MSVWQDVRFAVRLLLKERWFTVVAALALALGIGVNTTVFTIVNAILLRGLPFERPDRIVSLGTVDERGRPRGVSRLDFLDWQAAAHGYEGLAIFLPAPMNLTEDGPAPEQYTGTYIAASLFALVGQPAAMGRTFLPEDDTPGAPAVVVLGHTEERRVGHGTAQRAAPDRRNDLHGDARRSLCAPRRPACPPL